MKDALRKLKGLAAAFDAEDDLREPVFDPVHLGGVLILSLVTIGALYWILWTFLVYEGGFFAKIIPAAQVLFRIKTPADFGYRGPWDRGVFEGWAGNMGALIVAGGALTALFRLYWQAARRAKK